MTIPTHYTEAEGGDWRDWSHGNVDGRGLKKRDAFAVTINGITVHALKFHTGEEWDCVNGWRPEREPPPPPTPAPTPAPVPTAGEQVAKKALTESMRLEALSEKAQEYAMRVWSGQSVSLGRADRVARIKRALDGQGLPFDGVRLPGAANTDDDDGDDAPVTWRATNTRGIV
jgi:hypothetical protein